MSPKDSLNQKLKKNPKVAKLIEKNVEGCSITEGKGTDADKRDYEVSYAKIKKLGHKTVTVTVDDGTAVFHPFSFLLFKELVFLLWINRLDMKWICFN